MTNIEKIPHQLPCHIIISVEKSNVKFSSKRKDRMSESRWSKEEKLQLWGWAFFVLCGLIFTAGGIVNKDPLTLAGSLTFLIGSIFFLAPYFKK